MVQAKKVLFPTDFSDCSRQAFQHAVRLAKDYGAELHLMHAIVLHEDDPHNPAHHFPDRSRIRTILEELAIKRMGTLIGDQDIPDLVVRRIHRRGISAAPVIVDYAREEGIDLIAMGTHGRRGIRKLLLGSVAAEVIRLAPCGVLTIRGKADSAPSQDIRRILVPIDFHDPAKATLSVACDLAKENGSGLQLLHVVGELLPPAFLTVGPTNLAALHPERLDQARSALQDLFDETGSCQGVRVDTHVLEGHPGREIVRFAQDHDIDLIVMATHGCGGIKHFLLGGTAEKVIAAAECPILIVKGPGSSETC